LTPQLLFFQDFHICGASAPEWNQRYLQISPGTMRSTLVEWSTEHVHVFGKWMSERVVQQGELPVGTLCFAMLGSDTTLGLRVQGLEFGRGDLLVLRGGQEFEFQRPAGVELLSVTFGAESFLEFLDRSESPTRFRRAIEAGGLIRPEAAALDELRRCVRLPLSSRQGDTSDNLMQAVQEVLASAGGVPRQRVASLGAARLVRECQRMALTESREQPLRIEELCSMLRTSRRTLQNSFNDVTGMGPVAYLRNIRLNTARRRLMSTSPGELSVSHAAMDAGFDHLGHFAGAYKSLFGELPSMTARAAPLRGRAPTRARRQTL
jgi:AraC family ethanolamine operon transcriptional activator